ncbi:unnamed protein product [Clonostachys rosea]|uniref:Uncharacterized protein n=1 Tax=Bionectria ochroleuca TaxID=29856 RepID=A0ABY6U1S7_BIOOC|nr:unnamed protein product [Clonostachys rosea]
MSQAKDQMLRLAPLRRLPEAQGFLQRQTKKEKQDGFPDYATPASADMHPGQDSINVNEESMCIALVSVPFDENSMSHMIKTSGQPTYTLQVQS